MNLPNDVASENALLGSVIVTNHLAGQLLAELTPDDFHSPTNRQIFTAISSLTESAVEITPLTIEKEVKAQGGSQSVVTYCVGLYSDPIIGSLNTFIRSVKEKSTLRRAVRFVESVEARVDDGDSAQDVLTYLENSVNEMRARSGVAGSAFRSMAEVMAETAQKIEQWKDGETFAIPTGYRLLDQTTRGGIQPGDVWVIAALTGRGKSAWALECARHQAEKGIPVAVVSREMSDFENSTRMLAAASQIPAWKIESGMKPETFHWLSDWVPYLSQLPMWINSRTGNIYEIRSQVKELVRSHGLKSLFVDYLQLMSVSLESKNSTRAQEVATVSRVLKDIAMDNQIGVFALAQFNRGATGTETPDLQHLAESSGIEKDASLVLVLDMEKQKERIPGMPIDSVRECTMRIAKHRNGPLLSLAYRYRGDVLSFEEAA